MKTILNFFRQNTIAPIFLILFVLASIFVKNFLSLHSLMSILQQQAYIGIACVGATLLIISGNRDLSVGMVIGLSACLSVGLQPQLGLFSIVVAIVAGTLVGVINGLLVGGLGMNTFIVTLATMQGVRSITYMYTKEQSILGTSEAFANFGSGSFLGIFNLVWLWLIAVVIGYLILCFTNHGRNTYAIGGNKDAAFNAGINVTRTTVINFAICSFTAAIAGIVNAMRINSGIPQLGWPSTHFTVIVMVVLGGTKLSGGSGNTLYTVGGVLTLGIIEKVLTLLNVHTYYATLITGLLMLLVLNMDKVMTEMALRQREAEQAAN